MAIPVVLLIGAAVLVLTGFKRDPAGGVNPFVTLGSALGWTAADTSKHHPLNPGGFATDPGAGAVLSTETPRAAAFKAAVERKFPQARYLGTYNCRCTRGFASSGGCVSEHAFGNAVDFGGPHSLLLAIRNYALANALQFGVAASYLEPGDIDVHTEFHPMHACHENPGCSGELAACL